MSQSVQIILDTISVTNKVNFGNYEKLFRHFGFGDDHLLREAISANMFNNDCIVENDASSTSSTSTAQSIQRRTRSIVWDHFTTIDGKAKCNYCTR